MSLTPLLFSDWWEDLDHPHHLMDQNFGLGLYPEQLLNPRLMEYLTNHERQPRQLLGYYKPSANILLRRRGDSGGTSTVEADKDKFQVVLDVQQFQPDEIDVKVVDQYVIVTAKHEEKRDEHGWISRQFVRKYIVPEQCDIGQVMSKLSNDGVLTITAPRKQSPKQENERIIKIEYTGKPALQNPEQEKPKEKEAPKKQSKK